MHVVEEDGQARNGALVEKGFALGAQARHDVAQLLVDLAAMVDVDVVDVEIFFVLVEQVAFVQPVRHFHHFLAPLDQLHKLDWVHFTIFVCNVIKFALAADGILLALLNRTQEFFAFRPQLLHVRLLVLLQLGKLTRSAPHHTCRMLHRSHRIELVTDGRQ